MSLYPASKVSSELVCLVVASLGYGKSKPAGPIQSLLLKWIIVVYEMLEVPSILSNLYSVLFNMLDLLSLRYRLSSLGFRACLMHLARIFATCLA